LTRRRRARRGVLQRVTAGLGAAAFAWIDDWLGSKETILVSLVGLMIPAALLLFIKSLTLFWLFGMLLGVFVGPAQAAGRSYLAHAAPPALCNEMFGRVTPFLTRSPILI
jgi:UMF1 family MFS transporter